ncbi:MAG: hypothetical protein IH881_13140 [Myxococcales bacterium]|nr:hypothetical protein [Myxococcales bacterium]
MIDHAECYTGEADRLPIVILATREQEDLSFGVNVAQLHGDGSPKDFLDGDVCCAQPIQFGFVLAVLVEGIVDYLDVRSHVFDE